MKKSIHVHGFLAVTLKILIMASKYDF
jgi:hypothetical protein